MSVAVRSGSSSTTEETVFMLRQQKKKISVFCLIKGVYLIRAEWFKEIACNNLETPDRGFAVDVVLVMVL